MTQEEKAKAYDEALEKAKELLDSPRTCFDIEQLKDIFSELAESEDEKIRKEMIRYFTEMKKGGSAALPYDDCIAYLERQKETGIQWLKSDNVKNPDKPYIDKIGMFYTTDGRMCYASEIEKQKEDEGYEAIPVESTLEYKLGFKAGKESEKQKEQKPKMTPKWLYRLEFKDSSCGLWYDGSGKWCFEYGIGSIDGCKTKTLPMDYDARYKQDGRDWFSSCSRKEDLMHWYSLEDAKELISKGFVFTRYLATEYHEYDQQTVFIKETALYREEIDIFELFEQKKLVEWSEEDERKLQECIKIVERWEEDYDIAYAPYSNTLKSLRPQPKQVWTEEDDRICHLIMANLSESARHAITLPMETVNDFNNWLRTLQCMPPVFTDWNEEDQTLLSDALGCVTMVQELKKRGKLKNFHISCSYDELRSWVRSLKSRPRKQPSWKPSEEQIKAVEYAYNSFPNDCPTKSNLRRLYFDLKKLR